MTYCENCPGGHCEQLASSLPVRLKRVKLPDGTLSPNLVDISVVQGAIPDCPFNQDHHLTVDMATQSNLLGS